MITAHHWDNTSHEYQDISIQWLQKPGTGKKNYSVSVKEKLIDKDWQTGKKNNTEGKN